MTPRCWPASPPPGAGGSTVTRPASRARRSTPTSPPAWSPTTSAPSWTRPRRSAARACGSSSARDRPARTCRDLIPTVLGPRDRPRRAVHRRPRARHAARVRAISTTASQLAVEAGVSEIDALVLATAQPGRVPRLHRARRARAGLPGRHPLLRHARGVPALLVFQRGRLVASDGAVVPGAVADAPPPDFMRRSVHLDVPSARRGLRRLPSLRVAGCAPSACTTGRSPPRRSSPTPRTPRQRRGPPGRGRAAPAHRPHRAGLGARVRPRAAAPSRPPSATMRTTAWSSAPLHPRVRWPWRPPWPAWRRSAGARWPSTTRAPCWPSCRSPSAGLMSDRPAPEVADGLHRLSRRPARSGRRSTPRSCI